jgi:hypothetical protein
MNRSPLRTDLRLLGVLVLAMGTGTAAAAPKPAKAPKAAHAAGTQPSARASAKPWTTPEFAAAAQQLDAATRVLVEKGGARDDGYVYGMDIAPLMLYAAERKDEALYGQLLAIAGKLVVTGDDAATDGFVLWRAKDGAEPEITGAEEALWMARAYWAGSRAFGRAEDRARAGKIVAGWSRHAREREGVWSVAKYWSFSGKTLSALSVLGDYQGDFVSDAEAAAPVAKGLGQKSYAVIQRAATPGKLLLPVIQPELGAHFAGMGAQRYAPNDVVALADSCAGAEGAQRGLPNVARGVLAFAGDSSRLDADGRLYAYYQRKSGQPVGDAVLGSSGYACLARIAATLGDRNAASALQAALAGDMLALSAPGGGGGAPLYSAGPLLRAALALHAFQ